MSRDPLSWLDDEALARSTRGLTRRLVPHGAGGPGRIEIDGRSLINFGSNDYLGLAVDPRLARAAPYVAKAHGWGAGSSPLLAGWSDAHQGLAEALAAFEQTEAALLFPSGFAANLGTIAALTGPGDAVYVDRLDHACLIDGARLSGARLRVFPHNDAPRLAALLARDRGRFRRSLIATEGIFSMDGDMAPLADLVTLAEEFGAMLLVDEAHATGLFGPDGRGAAAACGVADRIPVRVGTLSKALGSMGGFVAGSKRLIDHLVNQARPLIFSTALPAVAVVAAQMALEISQLEPWRRERVFALADRLRAALGDAGIDVIPSVGPIVPVLLGEAERAVQVSERLRDRGLYVPAIRPPTVPEGTARLRISLTASHSEADVDALIATLTDRADENR